MVYTLSLLFREFFGRGDPKFVLDGETNVTEMFDSVPRAMLTSFRFFFGDFSTMDGINLFEALQLTHGPIACTFVSILFFMIVIGVFNVIAAIFVESTMAA